MSRPEFLCPIAQKPCPIAQVTGEVLSEQLLSYFGMASRHVATFGYLAHMKMKIDENTITNIRQAEAILIDTGKSAQDALKSARSQVIAEMLPAFLICGSESGVDCDISRGNKSEQEDVTKASLPKLAAALVQNLQSGQEI